MNGHVESLAQSSTQSPAASSAAPKNRSFVVFRMGGWRYALPAESIAELAPPVRLHAFPHRTPLLEGVIVRRGHIVPVYRASIFSGANPSAHASGQRFYLIARYGAQDSAELAAIPVAAECELMSGELQPADSRPAHVSGMLAVGDELIDILDPHKLFAPGGSSARIDAEVEVKAQS